MNNNFPHIPSQLTHTHTNCSVKIMRRCSADLWGTEYLLVMPVAAFLFHVLHPHTHACTHTVTDALSCVDKGNCRDQLLKTEADMSRFPRAVAFSDHTHINVYILFCTIIKCHWIWLNVDSRLPCRASGWVGRKLVCLQFHKEQYLQINKEITQLHLLLYSASASQLFSSYSTIS